jgi:CHAT domain-containing protein
LTRGAEASSPADPDWLPGARKEVVEIARLAKSKRINPTIWLGLDVNKQKLMSSSLSHFRFIHLAMHSLADYQDGYFSALTPSISSMEKGASILTSYEIADLKLDSDLVVLSGCETGVGQRTGAEGIISLTRTFLIAGSRCVCGSLWSVEDDSSERLMREFYNNLLAEGLDRAEALRQAKVALLRQGASPSRWAAFVLVGSPR